MKQDLDCTIVQDLLPNYIEKLTSNDTNDVIEQHLDTCEDCKKAYKQMKDDISIPEKAPVVELKFLKKVKRTRLLAAVLCVILTLVLSYFLYASEYKFTNNKNDLALAVTEFTAHSEHAVDAYILETKEIDGVLAVSFKDQANTDMYGVAVLVKGFNQRYRIIRAKIKSSNFSSVLQINPLEIKNKSYYAVSGYNISNNIRYYGLDYYAYSSPGYLSKDRVRESIKFDVKNPQFLEIYQAEELEELLENRADKTLYNPHLVTTSMYNADGMEITDNFRNQDRIDNQVSVGFGKAELFMLDVYIIIIMGLGIIITRYFLTNDYIQQPTLKDK